MTKCLRPQLCCTFCAMPTSSSHTCNSAFLSSLKLFLLMFISLCNHKEKHEKKTSEQESLLAVLLGNTAWISSCSRLRTKTTRFEQPERSQWRRQVGSCLIEQTPSRHATADCTLLVYFHLWHCNRAFSSKIKSMQLCVPTRTSCHKEEAAQTTKVQKSTMQRHSQMRLCHLLTQTKQRSVEEEVVLNCLL